VLIRNVIASNLHRDHGAVRGADGTSPVSGRESSLGTKDMPALMSIYGFGTGAVSDAKLILRPDPAGAPVKPQESKTEIDSRPRGSLGFTQASSTPFARSSGRIVPGCWHEPSDGLPAERTDPDGRQVVRA